MVMRDPDRACQVVSDMVEKILREAKTESNPKLEVIECRAILDDEGCPGWTLITQLVEGGLAEPMIFQVFQQGFLGGVQVFIDVDYSLNKETNANWQPLSTYDKNVSNFWRALTSWPK